MKRMEELKPGSSLKKLMRSLFSSADADEKPGISFFIWPYSAYIF